MKNIKLVLYLVILYIACIVTFIAAYFLYKNGYYSSIFPDIKFHEALLLILSSIVFEYFIIKYNSMAISPGFALTMALILCYGVFWTMVIKSISLSFRVLSHNGKKFHIFNIPFYKTLFNASMISIAVFCAGTVYYMTFLGRENIDPLRVFLEFSLLVGIFLFVHTGIISVLVSIISDSKLIDAFENYIKIGFFDIVFVSPFGVLLAFLYVRFSFVGIIFFIIPVVLIKYVFKLFIEE